MASKPKAKKTEVVFNRHDQIGQGKKTSIGGKLCMIKTSSMNKHKRKSYKQYRGQGR